MPTTSDNDIGLRRGSVSYDDPQTDTVCPSLEGRGPEPPSGAWAAPAVFSSITDARCECVLNSTHHYIVSSENAQSAHDCADVRVGTGFIAMRELLEASIGRYGYTCAVRHFLLRQMLR